MYFAATSLVSVIVTLSSVDQSFVHSIDQQAPLIAAVLEAGSAAEYPCSPQGWTHHPYLDIAAAWPHPSFRPVLEKLAKHPNGKISSKALSGLANFKTTDLAVTTQLPDRLRALLSPAIELAALDDFLARDPLTFHDIRKLIREQDVRARVIAFHWLLGHGIVLSSCTIDANEFHQLSAADKRAILQAVQSSPPIVGPDLLLQLLVSYLETETTESLKNNLARAVWLMADRDTAPAFRSDKHPFRANITQASPFATIIRNKELNGLMREVAAGPPLQDIEPQHALMVRNPYVCYAGLLALLESDVEADRCILNDVFWCTETSRIGDSLIHRLSNYRPGTHEARLFYKTMLASELKRTVQKVLAKPEDGVSMDRLNAGRLIFALENCTGEIRGPSPSRIGDSEADKYRAFMVLTGLDLVTLEAISDAWQN